MRISHYSFGSITVDGKTYTKDVIIYTDRVESPWWRKEGHLLQKEDLDGIVASGMKELVVGTGAYGAMQVPRETLSFLESRGIVTHVMKTSSAVDFYNRESDKHPLAAALHLTC